MHGPITSAMRVLAVGAMMAGIFFASADLTPRVLAYNNSGNYPCYWSYAGGQFALNVYWQNHPSYPPPAPDYSGPYSNARTSWNGSNTPVNFASSGSGSTYHGAIYLGVGPLIPIGTAQLACSGSQILSASIMLNRSYLEPFNGNSCSTAFIRQYTAAHELGHNLALGHSSVSPALMAASLDCSAPPAFNAHRADDECGVNHIYTSTGWPPTCGY